MAKKTTGSRAEKAVSEAKKKTSSSGSTSKSAAKKPKNKQTKEKKTVQKKAPAVKTEYENPIPSGVVAAIASFFLGILFLLIAIKPEGALLILLRSVVHGLIGKAGFYFSIAALFFVFYINTFGKKNAVRTRSICALLFVLLSGSIYHLLVHDAIAAEGIGLITELYKGGSAGTGGGILCGGLAMLLLWSCGTPLSYLITILGSALSLLGAMQITIPSLIRAIANRPRDDYDEDEESYEEPAAAMVNHIANKKIEQKRQRREQAAQAKLQASVTEKVLPESNSQPQKQKAEAKAPVSEVPKEPQPQKQPELPASQENVKQVPGKGAAFMNRIDVEIGAPLPGTTAYVQEDVPNVFDEPVASSAPVWQTEEPEIPARMPELIISDPISSAPKLEKKMSPPVKQAAEAKPAKVSAKDAAESAQLIAEEIEQVQKQQKPEYCFPPIDLLKRPLRGGVDGTEEMRENSRRLNETLASFNIDAHIINVTRGPSVTRYEVELDKGVIY